MSRFSGKCDICDIYGDYSDEQLRKSEFYIGRNPVPLRITSQHDLVPYYPHLIRMSTCRDGVATVIMTDESFIDSEEKQHLNLKMERFKKYRRKCKRNKIPYEVEEAVKAVLFFPESASDLDYEIARRVGEMGDRATIEGLHDNLHEYFRRELYREMLDLGWTEMKAQWWIWRDFGRSPEMYMERNEGGDVFS